MCGGVRRGVMIGEVKISLDLEINNQRSCLMSFSHVWPWESRQSIWTLVFSSVKWTLQHLLFPECRILLKMGRLKETMCVKYFVKFFAEFPETDSSGRVPAIAEGIGQSRWCVAVRGYLFTGALEGYLSLGSLSRERIKWRNVDVWGEFLVIKRHARILYS